MTGSSRPGFFHPAATIATAIAAFTAPIAADLWWHEQPRVFGYLAADTFYYLIVARNHHTTGAFTFDGEHLTNGYHPLWQWLLSPTHALLSTALPDYILLALVVIGVVCISLALAWLGRAWTRSDGYLSPLYPLVVPGVVALLSTPFYSHHNDHYFFNTPDTARPVFTTLWSFANGMETPLLLLSFCASAWVFLRRQQLLRTREAIGFGLLLLLVVLSRLDHVFFAGSLLCGMAGWAWVRHDHATMRRSFVSGAVLAGGLGLYLINNKLLYGTAMPISGLIKASNPDSAGANFRLLKGFLADPTNTLVAVASRTSQVLIPLVIALIYLCCAVRIDRAGGAPWIRLRDGRGRADAFLCWTALAVIALGLYNLLGVHWMSQGPWYVPISALFASLVVIRAADGLPVMQRLARSRLAMCLWLLLCLLASVAYFMRAHYHPKYQSQFARYYFEEAPKIRAFYGDDPPRILEYSDGLIGYATGFPVMSGAGFMLDYPALPAHRAQTLLSLAVERKYDRISNFLAGNLPVKRKITREHIRRVFPRIGRKDFDKFDFIPEYRTSDGEGVIFRVVPRTTPPAAPAASPASPASPAPLHGPVAAPPAPVRSPPSSSPAG